jgi:hypothetical protein
MSKSGSSRRLIAEIIIGVILVLALITTILVAVFVESINQQFIRIAFITLGILVLSFFSYAIFYRMYKARPELFYRDTNGNLRFKSRHDRFEYDERRSVSPYDSVRSDSYQYKPSTGYGKKPFTDFTLTEKTTCFICKLEIDKNVKIYRCPECKSPFHMDHLSDWLNENADCPVCNIELTL